jgi:hypothetical protein
MARIRCGLLRVVHPLLSPHCEDLHHVLGVHHVLEKGQHVVQLAVVLVVEPAGDGDRVLGLEHVRVRGVVHDDRVLQGSAQYRHIL